MSTIAPYKIAIPEEKLQRLKRKLGDTEYPDELDDIGWSYGVPLTEVKRLVNHWQNEFDWRKVEATLNSLPTFTTDLKTDFGAVELYFVHKMSHSKNSIPLLFIYGWPGSVLEVTKLIPLLEELETNGGPAFDIIAPCLPNFGFSSSISKPGYHIENYADTMNDLMGALGYEQYVVQGGDWGVNISGVMAMRHKNVVACHWNLVPLVLPKLSSLISYVSFLITHLLGLYSAEESEGLKRTPAGLLAWIYDKLHAWTDEYPWTDDEVCAWASMYWLSRSGPGASVRIYYEATRGDYSVYIPMNIPRHVKLGLAYFPKEMLVPPMAWAKNIGGEIVLQKRYQKGGHFAAWEQPEKIVEDLAIMFSEGGPAFACVPGRNGY